MHSYTKAFTMAEVLITLGIIGIIAAMTLPALIGNYQKKVTAGKLKKAYNTLSQLMLRSVADHGEANYWVDTSVVLTEQNVREYFDLYYAPYLRVSSYCDSWKTCGYPNDKAVTTFGGGVPDISFWGGRRVSVLTEDGMYMLFRSIRGSGNYDDTYSFSKTQQVFVDINAGKSPNAYGKDIFLFVLDLENPRVVPYGYNMTDEYINKYCYSSSANYLTTCTAKIMNDNWEITYY